MLIYIFWTYFISIAGILGNDLLSSQRCGKVIYRSRPIGEEKLGRRRAQDSHFKKEANSEETCIEA